MVGWSGTKLRKVSSSLLKIFYIIRVNIPQSKWEKVENPCTIHREGWFSGSSYNSRCTWIHLMRYNSCTSSLTGRKWYTKPFYHIIQYIPEKYNHISFSLVFLWVQAHCIQPVRVAQVLHVIWSCLVPYGPVWCCMVTYGPIWSPIIPCGPVWSPRVPFGPLGSLMVPLCQVSSPQVLYGLLLVHMVLFGPL